MLQERHIIIIMLLDLTANDDDVEWLRRTEDNLSEDIIWSEQDAPTFREALGIEDPRQRRVPACKARFFASLLSNPLIDERERSLDAIDRRGLLDEGHGSIFEDAQDLDTSFAEALSRNTKRQKNKKESEDGIVGTP